MRRWIHRYQQHGTAALADQPRSGRPRLGSPTLTKRILRLLTQPRGWTIPRMWHALGRPPISRHTLHRRVRKIAAWRRPRLVGDPRRDRVLADLQQQIRDLPEGAILLAEHETHINLLAWVRATWIPRGQRQHVMTPGKNRRRTIFGAIDLATGQWFYQVTRKAISATFIAFCQQLLTAYPAAPAVALVCDIVIIHRSKLVQRWLGAHPRLLVHGARYSPHDNPVERIWDALKAWLANNPTLTIQGRVRQVHAFFRGRTPAQMLATAAPHIAPWLGKAACKQPCGRSPRLPAVDFLGWARPACATRTTRTAVGRGDQPPPAGSRPGRRTGARAGPLVAPPRPRPGTTAVQTSRGGLPGHPAAGQP